MSHQTLPPVVLIMKDSAWPAASVERGAGVAEVGEWSLERELVGSTLPGNVRTRTGLSVGSGSATLAQPTNAAMAPWVKDPTRRVVANTPAVLAAETTAGVEPLGSWVTGAVSGSLVAPSVQVPLIEAQGPGKRGRNNLTPGRATDPGVLVAALARECGFHSVAPPVAQTLWSWPISYGADIAEKGLLIPDASTPVWSTASGALGARGVAGHTPADFWPSTFYVTANLSTTTIGWVSFQMSDLATLGVLVNVLPFNRQFQVQVGTGAPVSGSWSGTSDPNQPQRIQIEVRTVRSSTTGRWTSVAARVRASQTAPWSALVTATGSTTTTGTTFSVLSPVAPISGVQVSTNPNDAALYRTPTAMIEPLGGIAAGPTPRWVAGDTSPWDAIQQICGAHLAAGWVDRVGRFTCRGRAHLAGQGAVSQTISIADRVEDLHWTLDPADTADRLEVTYTPGGAVAQPAGTATTVYTAPEKLFIDPGASIEIEFPLEGPCDLVPTWIHAALVPPGTNIETYPLSIFSGMTAATGGTAINVLLFEIQTTRRSSGTGVVRILNKSGVRAWMVDANGAPCIIVKATSVTRYDTTQVVARGASSADAVNSISVQLDHWVATPAVAEEIADYIWARVCDPAWKASSVRVVLDWSLDLGQVVTLTHPETDLTVKALIARVVLAGSPGEIVQTIDIVLLPPTWTDFNAAWAPTTPPGNTWAQFNAYWAGKSWADFDNRPLSR